MLTDALAITTPTNPNQANLSWSQRFGGESLISDRRRRLKELAQADELVVKSSTERHFNTVEQQKIVGNVARTSAPNVAQSFVPPTGAELRAMMLRV